MTAHAPGRDCGEIALWMEHVQDECESAELPEFPSTHALLQGWDAPLQQAGARAPLVQGTVQAHMPLRQLG